MATKKAFIKLDLDYIIPITRGEAVLDSAGNEALHSYEFVASKSEPGLFTPEEKNIVAKAVTVSEAVPENRIVQVQKVNENNNTINVYPVTKAEAVIVNIDNKETRLDTVIAEVLDLDDYPTQNSAKGVTSGGVWQHIDDTVGAIHREINKI